MTTAAAQRLTVCADCAHEIHRARSHEAHPIWQRYIDSLALQGIPREYIGPVSADPLTYCPGAPLNNPFHAIGNRPEQWIIGS